MHLDDARNLKAELRRDLAPVRAQARASAEPEGAPAAGMGAVGISVAGDRYGVAVRWSGPLGRRMADRARELAGPDVDVREVGLIRALSAPAAGGDPRWTPEALQRRTRPLRPGCSIAHVDVTAGTLGAFVTVAGSDQVHVLSNNHVLANSGRATVGEAVLQPGTADGGSIEDRVGILVAAVPLNDDGAQLVDAALARLDPDVAIEADHPVGPITTWTEPDHGLLVQKVGRTTGLTDGEITAIELDDVGVDFDGRVILFDGQIEVTGSGGGFSAGGDSGSLVYLPDTREAVGLLFAGSQTGGPNGSGLTFCNPAGVVLDALGATLLE